MPAGDVFSLGATLCECVTLCRAFDGGTTEAVLQQILLQPTPDPRRLQPGLPRDLAAIVGRALEKDVARRYPGAGAFAADLRAFLDLRPVQARLPSPLQRLQRWVRREPLHAALAGTLVLAAALGAVLWHEAPLVRAQAAARVQQDYDDALARGWTLRWSDEREKCLTEFERARQLRPHGAEALAHLCLARRAFDGEDAALALLARERAGVDDGELVQEAQVLLLRMAGRNGEADALAPTVTPPRTPTALWLAGTADMITPGAERGLLRRALERISLAVRLSPLPRLPMVVQWASAAIVVDDDDALREAHRTLLEHWPDHPQALWHAARTMQRLDPQAAIALCERSRAAGMWEADGRWLEYLLWSKVGPEERALAALHACLPVTWDEAARTVLLDDLIRRGDASGARAAAEAWLLRVPGNARARLFLAQLSTDADPTHLLEVFRELVAQLPNRAAALHVLAYKQLECGQPAAARESLQAAIAAQPDFAPVHVTLVELLEAQHDIGGVLQEWRRWVALHPGDAEAHWGVAAALCNESPPEFAAALVEAMRANELAGGRHAGILETLATAHERLGESASAAACRERARELPAGGR
ncbi:MAG: hypothetical protein U1E73_11170 [Planctomycetota bacterium]